MCIYFINNPITNYSTLIFLYTLFLAIDTNFKLKQKDQGIKDVEIALGWGCYVETSHYKRHLMDYKDQPEVAIVNLVISYLV